MLKYIILAALVANFALVYSSFSAISQKPTQNVDAGPVCELCTLVLTAAQHLIEQNKTEDEIITFIEKNLCSKMGPLNSTCVQYIDVNGRAILEELSKKVDPSIVCKNIGLCSSGNSPATSQPDYKPMVDSNSLNCTLCKLVFAQVQNMLKNNASQAEILHYIENKLCNATGKFDAACRTMIDTFGPLLLEYLAKGTDPEKLCEMIEMCPPSSRRPIESRMKLVNRPIEPRMKPVNPLYCTLCQFALEFIDTELKTNKSESAIVDVLDRVCTIVPASMRTQCNSLVNSYGVYLVQLLVEMADPLKVCEAIQLCQ